MRKVAFGPGTVVKSDDGTFELLNHYTIEGIPNWQMRDQSTGILCHRPEAEIRAAYDVGVATFDSRLEPETPEERKRRRKRHGVPLSDLSEKKRRRVAYRKEVIREVEKRLAPGTVHAVVGWVERGGKSRPVTNLDRLCAELGRELGQKHYGKPAPCSAASYARWAALYAEHEDSRDLQGNFDKRGRKAKVDPLVSDAIKRVMARLLEAAKYRKPVGRRPVLSMAQIMTASLDEVKIERKRHPDRPLVLPDRSTFYVYYNRFPAELRSIARHGATKSRMLHRRPGDRDAPEAALSHLMFDETRLPFFVVHETLGIPLGRPWLAILVDVFSNAIVGFYIGFEPPGDLVIAATIRHACLMKSYVAQDYPDIVNPYLCGGVGRFFTFDNSLQAHGNSILQITADLDVQYDFTPPRSPWVKGEVEGAFAVAAQTFLQEMPGYVLSRDLHIDNHDYDPTQHAVIGLRHLMWLWHHWLLGVYHPNAPRNGTRLSPNQRWLDGTRIVKPCFLERGTDLDFLFGIVREGRRLDNRGVVYEQIYYYSDGIDILRRHRGASIRVKVKVNPINLARIHVWDPDEEIWIPAFARDRSYADGLDLHTHTLYRRHTDRLSGRDDLEGWIESRAHLHGLIDRALPDALGIQIQAKIARSMGMGSDRMYAELDPLGRRPGSPTPLLGPTGRPLAIEGPPADRGAGLAVGAGPAMTETAAAPRQVARRARAIPVFSTDHSLG